MNKYSTIAIKAKKREWERPRACLQAASASKSAPLGLKMRRLTLDDAVRHGAKRSRYHKTSYDQNQAFQ